MSLTSTSQSPPVQPHSRVGTDASDASTLVLPHSSISRGNSLRRKNVDLSESKFSDVLSDRYTSWKHIVKELLQYFNGIMDLEISTGKDYQRISSKLTLPFKDSNQFMPSGGIQDVFFMIREKTKAIADAHSSAAKHIDAAVIQQLEGLRTTLKRQVKSIDDDTGKLEANVKKERDMSTKYIAELARDIAQMKAAPLSVKKDQDPFLLNFAVKRQLAKQIAEENQLYKSLLARQEQCRAFEESLVAQIQNILKQFDEQTIRSLDAHKAATLSIAKHVEIINTDTEWNDFEGRNQHLLDPNAPMRSVEHMDYPGKNDPAHEPIKTGVLQRQGKLFKSYKQSYFVMTPAGYLHEYKSTDLTKDHNPEMSLFLPDCSLSQPSSPKDKVPKFTITGKEQGLLHREHVFTYKAMSYDDMMEWYNAIREFTKETLSSTTTDHRGPIMRSVSTQGLPKDSENEDSAERKGDDLEEGTATGQKDIHSTGRGEDELATDVAATSQETPEMPTTPGAKANTVTNASAKDGSSSPKEQDHDKPSLTRHISNDSVHVGHDHERSSGSAEPTDLQRHISVSGDQVLVGGIRYVPDPEYFKQQPEQHVESHTTEENPAHSLNNIGERKPETSKVSHFKEEL